MKALGAGNFAVAALFFAEAHCWRSFGAWRDFSRLPARTPNSALDLRFADYHSTRAFPRDPCDRRPCDLRGSAAAIRRAVQFDPVFRGCGETHERSQPIQQGVAARRVGSPHSSMFLRMLWRAAALRRGRAASALLAMVVAASGRDCDDEPIRGCAGQAAQEFRSYGANVVVVAGMGLPFPRTC